MDTCVTRDGSSQPRGTAFDRVVTSPDGSDFNPGPGLALVLDDGRALYVQNSGVRPVATGKVWPTYANDKDAMAHGLVVGDIYNSSAGLQQVGGGS